MAVPESDRDFVFISSGTWSLLGTELKEPVIDDNSQECNLTNELGFDNTVTFLKNITGLWLIQETRRQFQRDGRQYSYADLENMARQSRPFTCFIDPDAREFMQAGDIPERIRVFCKETGQYVPEDDGEVVRCIYESLAMKYRCAFEQLKHCTKKDFNIIHMVGGGTRDSFLCQMTADAVNIPVLAGPVEATALGNAAAQLIALGLLDDLRQARAVIRKTFSPKEFLPSNPDLWSEYYRKFTQVIQYQNQA
jgi:rhamnulokinase/L-fuculokinase